MFHNKTSLLCIIVLLIGGISFSQSKSIRTLELDFHRTETSVEGESASMSGFIVYASNPYVFSFTTTEPVQQVSYTNSDGTYVEQNNTLYDYSEGQSILNQTCHDFLTWFKADLDLYEQGYKPVKSVYEDGQIVSTWLYSKVSVHPYEKIIVYSNENGTFSRLMMYTTEDTLYAQTYLSNFEFLDGIYYPTTISTESYAEGKVFVKTTLKFSNIRINKGIDSSRNGNTLTVNTATEQRLITTKKMQAQKPEEKKYNTSSSQILINVGFSFYKKFITNQDNSACPFTPSCSQYMKEAVSKNGLFGLIQGLDRVKRCTSTEHSRNLYPVTQDSKHLDPVH